jgi:phospholipid/cholesterol/gamma-HCH transport system substrate-binding protein
MEVLPPPMATDGQRIKSHRPIEFNDIIISLHATALNAEIVSQELAEVMLNINSGQGTLGRLIQDPEWLKIPVRPSSTSEKARKGLMRT